MRGRKPDLAARARYERLLRPHVGKSSSEIAAATGLRCKHVQKLMKTLGLPRLAQGPRTGEKNQAWKGGRRPDKTGYILVRCDHPNARNGYVREHRLVMERHLGRLLLPSEVVHHRNGVRADNRLANLELFASNAAHLASELKGRVPRWSEAGRQRILAALPRRVWKSVASRKASGSGGSR